jgi:hypothetical protein
VRVLRDARATRPSPSACLPTAGGNIGTEASAKRGAGRWDKLRDAKLESGAPQRQVTITRKTEVLTRPAPHIASPRVRRIARTSAFPSPHGKAVGRGNRHDARPFGIQSQERRRLNTTSCLRRVLCWISGSLGQWHPRSPRMREERASASSNTNAEDRGAPAYCITSGARAEGLSST